MCLNILVQFLSSIVGRVKRFCNVPEETTTPNSQQAAAATHMSSSRSSIETGLTGPENIRDWNSCESGKETLIVIFFHGLELNDGVSTENKHLTTWSYQDEKEQCWPRTMFKEDVELQQSNIVIRALAASYDSSKYTTNTEGRVDIFNLGENLAHTIITEVKKMHKQSGRMTPVILVAHSIGGLVVQEMISHAFTKVKPQMYDASARQFLRSLSGIFFYSTPQGSLKNETYEAIFSGGRGKVTSHVAKLQSEHNVILSRKRGEFVNIIAAIENEADLRNHKKIEIQSVFESLPTKVITSKGKWEGMIVEEGSSRSLHLGNDTYTNIKANHFDVCRPESGEKGFGQNQYQFLKNFILRVMES
ncbi:protein SERAC1 [Marchantia polymorpha subsp. ruderalis]|uniref:DUF676 domain-containing protein n=4 Tax=Marchantia polymorpha TaxID=3197 RepID=A0AAF6BBZ5_MARPO|nr:hypothetical protein MARPO_0116s0050 [Marchantia polymorpha]BBN09529.1 hypothetical protein Mp_4g20490 [Marchantia polymorpha subsp. ruderalis]|eukprot:PTQ31065.1 hypothetical protein MARPO_0116s0050 [Marchantia polymorpha]